MSISALRKNLCEATPEIGLFGEHLVRFGNTLITTQKFLDRLGGVDNTKKKSQYAKRIQRLDAKVEQLRAEAPLWKRILIATLSFFQSLLTAPTPPLNIEPYRNVKTDDRVAYNLKRAAKQQNKQSSKDFALSEESRPSDVGRGKGKKSIEHETHRFGDVKIGEALCVGRRKKMEDVSLACKLDDGSVVSAVFDGHAGDGVAKKLKEQLPDALEKALKSHPEDTYKALKECCSSLDKNFGDDECGSTAIIALVHKKNVWIACVGDSRAILVTPEKTTQLSEDANPDNKRYMRKIIEKGGQILDGRVAGVLAVARAFGDNHIQSEEGTPLISAKPKISAIPLTDLKEGRLVLCSDGLTDVASTDEIGEAVRAMGNTKNKTMARRLVGSAHEKRSKDNIAVQVLTLK